MIRFQKFLPRTLCISLLALAMPASAVVTEKVLHAFAGGNDGAFPEALISDSAGNFYGIANGAGNANGALCSSAVGAGCGTIFKLSPNSTGGWTQTILYRFG